MPPSHHCAGCDSLFTQRGFHSHIQQTKNPLCRLLNSNPVHTAHPSSSSSSVEPAQFTGDAFGTADEYNQAGEDFGQDELDANGPDFVAPELDGLGDVQLDPDEEEAIRDAETLAELEGAWEPDRAGAPCQSALPSDGAENDMNNADILPDPLGDDISATIIEERIQAERCLIGEGHGVKPKVTVRYSDVYPISKPGAATGQNSSADSTYISTVDGCNNPWAPFTSKVDWEIARWAKLRGAGSTAFSELLSIDGVQDALQLSYKNSNELNKVIDKKLPGRPTFKRYEVVIHGEATEFYARDVMECLRALWADPEFADELIFEPEQQYADDEETVRMYHDMHTANWWWNTQKRVDDATRRTKNTIVPVMISSDKTQLTQFRNKTAYPVYLTIGNLPKHIRRKPSRQGQVLLAYLPTSKLKHITNLASRRRAQANLFHGCMKHILKPLETAGRDGVIFVSGDGARRRCYPIFATFIGDYPEQVLVTLVKTGLCPVCPAPREGIGEIESICDPREAGPVLSALNTTSQGPVSFAKACRRAGIKPVPEPFWKNLPFVNIYQTITPDILHQLYQGVLKHMFSWVQSACGEAEIDARCRRMPPSHNIQLFMKGISHLSRVTGTEHDQMSRFLLGLVLDIQLPDYLSSRPLIRAVRGLLDFLYLARYPVHTTETLDHMDDALRRFHDNKEIFITLGIRQHFDIPKIHYAGHYRSFIELCGTTDNTNTENTERLHIDMAKDAYAATNRKDEYPQMTAWLDRRERVMFHEKYIQRRLAPRPAISKPLPSLIPERRQQMAKNPTRKAIPISILSSQYGATFFESALSRFIVSTQHPEYTKAQIESDAESLHIAFTRVPVFHRLKFVSYDIYSLTPLANVVVDSLHVEPERIDKYGKPIPGRFDTAVINFNNGGEVGVAGYCVGRIRCIFTLPTAAVNNWFPRGFPHEHLAYVEWFTPFSRAIFDSNSRLYRISPLRAHGERQVSIIPITLIRQSVHLFPKFGPIAPVEWKSSNVLDLAESFYVNPFSDRFAYSTIY